MLSVSPEDGPLENACFEWLVDIVLMMEGAVVPRSHSWTRCVLRTMADEEAILAARRNVPRFTMTAPRRSLTTWENLQKLWLNISPERSSSRTEWSLDRSLVAD